MKEENEEINLVKSFFLNAGIDLNEYPLQLNEETESKDALTNDTSNYLVDHNEINATAKYDNGIDKKVIIIIDAIPDKIEIDQLFTINVGKKGDEYFSVEFSLHHNSTEEIPIAIDSSEKENFLPKISQIKFYREKMETSHTSYVKMKFGTRYILLPYLVIFK